MIDEIDPKDDELGEDVDQDEDDDEEEDLSQDENSDSDTDLESEIIEDRKEELKIKDEDRITPAFLTKYEKAKVIGTRA